MMKIEKLRLALLSAFARNKDAFLIIGAVSGIGEKRVREIANGRGASPTDTETRILSLHAEAK